MEAVDPISPRRRTTIDAEMPTSRGAVDQHGLGRLGANPLLDLWLVRPEGSRLLRDAIWRPAIWQQRRGLIRLWSGLGLRPPSADPVRLALKQFAAHEMPERPMLGVPGHWWLCLVCVDATAWRSQLCFMRRSRRGLSTNRAIATTAKFMRAVNTKTKCQPPVADLIRLATGTRKADAPLAV